MKRRYKYTPTKSECAAAYWQDTMGEVEDYLTPCTPAPVFDPYATGEPALFDGSSGPFWQPVALEPEQPERRLWTAPWYEAMGNLVRQPKPAPVAPARKSGGKARPAARPAVLAAPSAPRAKGGDCPRCGEHFRTANGQTWHDEHRPNCATERRAAA